VKYFTAIPSRFLRDIHVVRTHLFWILQEIETLGRDFVTGKKKNELTCWWLTIIEERVDEYLRNLGFQSNSIGNMYTSVPPDNLDTVENNYMIFEGMMKANLSEYMEFILKTTEEIYTSIDPFIEEMRLLLDVCKVAEIS